MQRALFVVATTLSWACGAATTPVEPARPPPTDRIAAPAEVAGTRAPSLPPPEPDVVPTRPGTVRESLAARPWWGVPGYAPQVPRLADLIWMLGRRESASDAALRTHASSVALFAAAERTPQTGPLRGELLACAIRVAYEETKLAAEWIFPIPLPLPASRRTAADLRAALLFGAFAAPARARPSLDEAQPRSVAVEGDGPEDSNTMVLTAPVVDLAVGDPISIELTDRGVFSRDATFPTLRTTYDGRTPILFSTGPARSECRVVPSAVRDEHLERALRATDETLHHLDITFTGSLGQRPLTGALTGRLRYAAALVGWSDPRVVARIERAALLFRRIHEEVRAEAEAKVRSLPPPGTWTDVAPGRFAIRIDGIGCGAAALAEATRGRDVYQPMPGCALLVTIKNTSSQETSAWGGSNCSVVSRASMEAAPYIAELRIRDRFGRTLPCSAILERGSRGFETRLPPGGTTRAVFDVHHESDLAKPQFGADPRPFDGDLAYVRPLLVESAHQAERYGPPRKVWLRTE